MEVHSFSDQKQKYMITKQNNKFKNVKKTFLNVGDVCDLKITALGPNNIGIDEYSYAYSILVPFAQLGETVKAKIVKLQFSELQPNKKIIKFAVAKAMANLTIKKELSPVQKDVAQETSNTLKVGEILTLPISKIALDTSKPGQLKSQTNFVAELDKNYKIYILSPNTGLESYSLPVSTTEHLDIEITRIKTNYAFAKFKNVNQLIVMQSAPSPSVLPKGGTGRSNLDKEQLKGFVNPANKIAKVGSSKGISKPGKWQSLNQPTSYAKSAIFNKAVSADLEVSGLANNQQDLNVFLKEGNKLTLVLPKKVKRYACLPNHVVLRLGNTVLFVNLALGAVLGNRVKIKLTKVLKKDDLLATQIAMAKVIAVNPLSFTKKRLIVKNSVCQMLKSGMHFGEKAIKCDARMKNYVWLRQKGQNKNKPLLKKGCNVINLLKTRRCLNKALMELSKYAAKGRTFLFVGTKKPAAALITRASLFSKTSFFVNTRWLGGMLTNWKTILKSISKIRPILKEKQTIIKEILTKRQKLKSRLIEKAILLRKKSKILLKKGRSILKNVESNSITGGENKLKFKEKNQKLIVRAEQLMGKTQQLLETRQKLLKKKQQLLLQSDLIKEKSNFITNKYKTLLNQVAINRKKLTELKSLFVIAKQIKKLKTSATTFNTNVLTLSYNQFKKFNTNEMVIPNPPKSILNKIVLAIRSTAVLGSGTAQAYPPTAETKNQNTREKVVIVSRLLSKFSLFIPYVRECIKIVYSNIEQDMSQLKLLKQTLTTIKQKMSLYAELKVKINLELRKIKTNLLIERQTLIFVKRKLKQLSSEIRLLKFLPKLRYLSTPHTKMYETVQILMKKIVDPKLKYPMHLIYDQKLSLKSKKVMAARKKSWQRLEKYFGGIANMTKMKKNQINKNVAIIIGQQEEQNAVRECKKLGIKMFNIVDTNCNPTLADHFIPANDDSRNSIKYILTKFLTRIRLAQKISVNVKKLARVAK